MTNIVDVSKRKLAKELDESDLVHNLAMKSVFYAKYFFNVNFLGRVYVNYDSKPKLKVSETIYYKIDTRTGIQAVPVCLFLYYNNIEEANELTIDRLLLHELAYYVILQNVPGDKINVDLFKKAIVTVGGFTENDRLLPFGEQHTLVCSKCKQPVVISPTEDIIKKYLKTKTPCCNGMAMPGGIKHIEDMNVVPYKIVKANKAFYEEFNRQQQLFNEFYNNYLAWERNNKIGNPPNPIGINSVFVPLDKIGWFTQYKNDYIYKKMRITYN